MKQLLLLLTPLFLISCGGGFMASSPFPEERAVPVTMFTPEASELDSLAANGNARGFRTYEFHWKRDSLELISTTNRSISLYKNSVNVYPGEKVLFRAPLEPEAPLVPVKNPREDEEYIEIYLEQAEATKEMFFTVKNKQNQGIRFHMLVNPDVNKNYYIMKSCPIGMQSEKMERWEHPTRSVLLFGFEPADALRDPCWD